MHYRDKLGTCTIWKLLTARVVDVSIMNTGTEEFSQFGRKRYPDAACPVLLTYYGSLWLAYL